MPKRKRNIYEVFARQEAKRAGIDPNIFANQIRQESGFNPNAKSGAGAIGIAQIVPKWHPGVNVNDPYDSLKYAAHYMAGLIHKYGSYEKALSVYNSGQPNKYLDPNFAGGQTYNYVRSIMGGQTPSAVNPSKAPPGPAAVFAPTQSLQQALVPDKKQQATALLRGLLEDQPISSLIQTMRAAKVPAAPTAATLGGIGQRPTGTPMSIPKKVYPAKTGIPVVGLTGIGGEHDTAGLAGYPAKDYFAPPGSVTVAPVTGKVIKLSGHDPALGAVEGAGGPLGWSVYIQGVDGHIYYLTHMGSRNVKIGEVVKAGTPIGTVANYDKYGRASHIHMGVR